MTTLQPRPDNNPLVSPFVTFLLAKDLAGGALINGGGPQRNFNNQVSVSNTGLERNQALGYNLGGILECCRYRTSPKHDSCGEYYQQSIWDNPRLFWQCHESRNPVDDPSGCTVTFSQRSKRRSRPGIAGGVNDLC